MNPLGAIASTASSVFGANAKDGNDTEAALAQLEKVLDEALQATMKMTELSAEKNTAKQVVQRAAVNG